MNSELVSNGSTKKRNVSPSPPLPGLPVVTIKVSQFAVFAAFDHPDGWSVGRLQERAAGEGASHAPKQGW